MTTETAPAPVLDTDAAARKADVAELKGSVAMLTVAVATIKATLPHMATQGDLERLRGDLRADMERLRAAVHATINGLLMACYGSWPLSWWPDWRRWRRSSS